MFKMNIKSGATKQVFGTISGLVLVGALVAGCAGGPITTREKGAGIGALGGAAVGGLIGSAVRHPALGPAISCKDVKTRLGSKISRFTGINRTSLGSARSWKISDDGHPSINPASEAEM